MNIQTALDLAKKDILTTSGPICLTYVLNNGYNLEIKTVKSDQEPFIGIGTPDEPRILRFDTEENKWGDRITRRK